MSQEVETISCDASTGHRRPRVSTMIHVQDLSLSSGSVVGVRLEISMPSSCRPFGQFAFGRRLASSSRSNRKLVRWLSLPSRIRRA